MSCIRPICTPYINSYHMRFATIIFRPGAHPPSLRRVLPHGLPALCILLPSPQIQVFALGLISQAACERRASVPWFRFCLYCKRFIFVYLYGCFAMWVSVCCVDVYCSQRSEEASDALYLESQTVVSCHSARNQTQDLYKSSKCF